MGHGLYSSFEAPKCAHLRITETPRADHSNPIPALAQQSFVQSSCPKEPGLAPTVAVVEDTTMRKAIAELDDEQRAVLLEVADLGTAVFSSGLIVAILKSLVDLLV